MHQISRKFFELIGFSIHQSEDGLSVHQSEEGLFVYFLNHLRSGRTEKFIVTYSENRAWEKFFSDRLDDFGYHLLLLRHVGYSASLSSTFEEKPKVTVWKDGNSSTVNFEEDPCFAIRKATVELWGGNKRWVAIKSS